MFCTIGDFIKSWTYESGATLKVFRNLTDSSLGQRVDPEGRTLGVLAWHITTSVPGILGQARVPFPVTAGGAAPSSAAAIAEVHEKCAQAVAAAVTTAWTDAQLPDEIPMYGQTWTKGAVLVALITHQAHHRGQMTVLMRQAGLKVPGVYGPAREEWAAMGMPAQP
ncbi:MAG: DinB family protein [Bryobacteraceae bacterium]|jgi:uncharacterized damage-inducible protein DinB